MNNINGLKEGIIPEKSEIIRLLSLPAEHPEISELKNTAREISLQHFGNKIYARGLIEVSNYCRNNCYYCGIRRGNQNLRRYRLTKEEILESCRQAHKGGFRTFVLQGGEDPQTIQIMEDVAASIRQEFPDCAITLSLGELDHETYQRLYNAGADRYLLRHETADSLHYSSLHPAEMNLESRLKCLQSLKDIGYQVGCGMMIGSPGQTLEHLAKDVAFMAEFKPHMIGMGPFLPHRDTPFKGKTAGSMELTLRLISIMRIILPKVLLPATTALASVNPQGRRLGILSGANVIMPNISPMEFRKDYSLYNGKLYSGSEGGEAFQATDLQLQEYGYRLIVHRGDSPEMAPGENAH